MLNGFISFIKKDLGPEGPRTIRLPLKLENTKLETASRVNVVNVGER